ncbi:F-box protein At5g49610-like [Spinacia oleracea]|uniref:F-box protein At5g49610-like n=1 Tax=Spinacia oleracea TaxID=3562 RepID=A0ABM3REJ9_SPIOL|nr:F-box protein At5g49610-like [Spinacia oleracea]
MSELSTSQLLLTPNSSINNILNDSLLIEILQRLPCNSVLRAKSVCKHWFSLLSDPYFHRTFVRYHEQHALPFTLVYEFHFWRRCLSDHLHHNFHTVSDHKNFQLRGFHLGFLPCFQPWESHPIWVVASHKDLLVCCHLKISLLQGVYYICNPLTKQWLDLPPSPGHHRVADTAVSFITSEKSVSLNSFKLVQIPKLDSCHSNSNCFEVNMFCSEEGEWRKFKITSPRSFTRTWQFRPESITFKNKFHWLVNSSNVVVVDPFEITSGFCQVIGLPADLNPDIGICLGSCHDNLRVCQISRGWSNCELIVWKLLDYVTGNWDLECKISLKEMAFFENVRLHKFGFSTMEVLAFHPADFGVLYLRFDNQIVLCNVRRKTLEVVSECLQDSSFSVGTCGVFLLMHPCWPSMIPSLPLLKEC